MTASQLPSVAGRPHSATVCAPAAQAPHGGRALWPCWLVVAIWRESFAKLTAHAEFFRKLPGGAAETALSRTIAEFYNHGKRSNLFYFGEAC